MSASASAKLFGRAATEYRAAAALRIGGKLSPNEVLINKLGIKDQAQLRRIEARFAALAESRRTPMAQMNYEAFKQVHRQNFQSVYAWAGKEREYTTGRGPVPFARPEYIKPQMNRLFGQLNAENNLKGLNADAFANRAAHYVNEINAVHPFVEGNGRVTRGFLKDLAAQAGHRMDYSKMTAEGWNAAAKQGFETGDPTALSKVIRSAMVPVQKVELTQAARESTLKPIVQYQETLSALKAARRDPKMRSVLLAQEKAQAAEIAASPALLKEAKAIGLDAQIKVSSASYARAQTRKAAKSFSRGRGI